MLHRVKHPTLYLGQKVKTAIARIREFEREDGYHFADSGGKDSCTVLALAKMAGVKYDAHFAFTTVDPPEVLSFLKEFHPETEWHRPEKSMWKLIIEKRIPPSRRMRYCCEKLKERLGSGRRVLTGLRSAESKNRAGRQMTHTCLKDGTKTFINPIIDWLESEVWDFIQEYKIPYCSLYDEGFDRIGCVMCPLASYNNRRRDADRFPGFYKAYMRTFQKMLDERLRVGNKGNWETAQDVMDWYLSSGKKSNKIDEVDQLPLFS